MAPDLDVAVEAAAISDISKSQIFVFNDDAFDRSGVDERGVRHWQHLIASKDLGEKFVWQELRSEEEVNRNGCYHLHFRHFWDCQRR